MKSLVVRIMGGTASQLFGLYRGYIIAKHFNRELILDIASFTNGYYYPYALDYLGMNFKKLDYLITKERGTTDEILPSDFMKQYHPKELDIQNRSMDELMEMCQEHDHEDMLYFITDGHFFMYPGYPAGEEIKEMIKPKGNLLFLKAFEKEIKDKTTVAVYARRGEYVMLNTASGYAFFQAGIQIYKEKYPDVIFYIFSDDLEDVKKNLGNDPQFCYVKLVGGADAHIETLLCLSACDHRLIGRTLWSVWSWFLRTKPESTQIYDMDAQFYYPMEDEYAIFLEKEDIETAAKRYHLSTENLSPNTVETDLASIKSEIKAGNIDQALELVIRLSFDSYHVNLEQREQLTIFFEEICGIKGDILRLDQCLTEHFAASPQSSAVNNGLVLNKIMQNKPLQGCFYGKKLCELLPDSADMMRIMFMGTGYEETFEKLLKMPKYHFVIRSNCQIYDYKMPKDSLLIWLRRLGHDVSILRPKSRGTDLASYTNETILEETRLNAEKISYKSDSGFILFPIFRDNSKPDQVFASDSVGILLDKLQQSNPLPLIFINRNLTTDTENIKVPMFYWDFSCKGDQESQKIIQELSGSMESLDRKLCRDKPAVITTSPQKVPFFEKLVGKGRVFCCHNYAEPYYKFIEEPLDFEETTVSHPDFLTFILDVLDATTKLTSKD